jgi:pyruvate/2-oxoacid:ferredoxin oxidoreductase beta subunit/Pyruvate/2-oxoacid:ferredoxin oxidoreductase gamma subunit
VILEKLNDALVKLQLDPHKVVIITDIGCAGHSDKYFNTNAFHGLHGRSVTYATGMKLANPDLNVIVLIGDGGCGIGGHHLINAARRNIGVTVLVFNNLNYGQTGGEHSVTTPYGAKTATTRNGNLERPMDICQTVAVNGAGFVARTSSFDKALPDIITEAIQEDGFALIDIWELCTAYYAPNNKFNRKALEDTLEKLRFQTGILHHQTRAEYSWAYRSAVADQIGAPIKESNPITTKYRSSLDTIRQGVIAGKAGMKTITAAAIFSKGALLSGLWTSQRNDYEVTVKSGYSVSEVTISPDEILFTGLIRSDFLLVLFPEALPRVRQLIEELSEDETLYINDELLPVTTNAKIVPLPLKDMGKKKYWAITSLAEVLTHSKLYPLEAYREAITIHKEYAGEYLAAYDTWAMRIGLS